MQQHGEASTHTDTYVASVFVASSRNQIGERIINIISNSAFLIAKMPHQLTQSRFFHFTQKQFSIAKSDIIFPQMTAIAALLVKAWCHKTRPQVMAIAAATTPGLIPQHKATDNSNSSCYYPRFDSTTQGHRIAIAAATTPGLVPQHKATMIH